MQHSVLCTSWLLRGEAHATEARTLYGMPSRPGRYLCLTCGMVLSYRTDGIRLAKVKSNGHHLPQPEPYFQSASIRLTKQSKTPMVARDHEISLINKRNVMHQVTRFEVVVGGCRSCCQRLTPDQTGGKRRYGHYLKHGIMTSLPSTVEAFSLTIHFLPSK
jgi:hypothetical protein